MRPIDAPLLICLPTADRVRARDFYRDGLGLQAPGPPASDGVPEPLVLELNGSTRLMLIPAGGFGWVIGDRRVAEPGTCECLLGLSAGTEAEVRAVVARAVQAGATVVTEPGERPWGFTAAFADPDGHVWTVDREPEGS